MAEHTTNGAANASRFDRSDGSVYDRRRAWLAEYFDRTAARTWAQLTSDAPVRGVRRTVRAGRELMRTTLRDWLPADLTGRTVLDAGCGTGMLAIELAQRGARVIAIDLSPTLVGIARERAEAAGIAERIDFRATDMLDASRERVDHVVCMDSLIHYPVAEMVGALALLAGAARLSVLTTFAPRTPLLSVIHATGRLFPRGSRAPAIEPVAESALRREIAGNPALAGWQARRTFRVATGFYTSEAFEMARTLPERDTGSDLVPALNSLASTGMHSS